MAFLAKAGAVLIVAGHSVKLGSKNSTPTAKAAAKGTRASAVPKISHTPDPMATSSSRHDQTKTLERTIAVRTARTTPLATGDKAAKAATTRSDIPRPKYVTQEKVRDATARSARAYKESKSGTPEPRSKIVVIAEIPITGLAHAPTNTKKLTIDSERQIVSDYRLDSMSNDDNDVCSLAEDVVKEDLKLPQALLAVRCDICDKVYDNAVALKIHKTYTHMLANMY
uniref:C2H2-type domain-containing protein n=1 Tax=Glossina palpalis gambiensis TaxID=67801 RepID=A0A1B0C2K8_9MUSC